MVIMARGSPYRHIRRGPSEALLLQLARWRHATGLFRLLSPTGRFFPAEDLPGDIGAGMVGTRPVARVPHRDSPCHGSFRPGEKIARSARITLPERFRAPPLLCLSATLSDSQ